MENTRRTQLFQIHKETAKTVAFAGFEMPLWYKGIGPEHLAVRKNVGIFDISHMGRFQITGKDSERFLNYVITNDVSVLAPGAAQYSVMCNENGGILDDFVVYRLEPERFLVVFNASNREKCSNWLMSHVQGFDAKIENISDSVAMLSVQGPKTETVLQSLSATDLGAIGRFKCGSSQLADVRVLLSRTGYTGEDGFEVFIWDASLTRPDNAVRLWKEIVEAGTSFGIEPCGLGARDTLRLEAGMCLYGSDIDENTTPLEAALGFVVKLQKEMFIGKEALVRQKAEGVKSKRVGIGMVDQGIPRLGFEILDDKSAKIGKITSGTFSPLLNCGIGMGYVQTPYAQEGTDVNVLIRGRSAKAKVVSFPFYDPEVYGFRRKPPAS